MIGISACLGGVACRYDGKSQTISELVQLVNSGKAEMICPEVEGGLPIPRNPAEIVGGDGHAVWQGTAKVVDNQGTDVTLIYQNGAKLAYQRLCEKNIEVLLLKEKSPSCGGHQIYDGTFSGNKLVGVGVATAYFLSQGMIVYSEADWESFKDEVVGGLDDV